MEEAEEPHKMSGIPSIELFAGASGLAIGFSAFSMAAKRVFARFFLPYQSAPSR